MCLIQRLGLYIYVFSPSSDQLLEKKVGAHLRQSFAEHYPTQKVLQLLINVCLPLLVNYEPAIILSTEICAFIKHVIEKHSFR